MGKTALHLAIADLTVRPAITSRVPASVNRDGKATDAIARVLPCTTGMLVLPYVTVGVERKRVIQWTELVSVDQVTLLYYITFFHSSMKYLHKYLCLLFLKI